MMERKSNSGFKVVGELVEARSFQSGFRGAWFRCKVRRITKRHDREVRFLEFYDFPDDKLTEMKIYQVPPHLWNRRNKPKELMLRPQYPPICNEKQMPKAPSELTVIVDDSWKVGDLVDWWTDGCYWSGKITKLLGDDKAQVELKPPPHGEGSVYQVFYKDLRPSLDWSPGQGWTIPCEEWGSGCAGARLMEPVNEASSIDDVSSKPDISTGVPSDAVVSHEAAKSTETREEMITKQSPDKEEEEEEEEGGHSSPKLAGVRSVPSNLAVFDEAVESTETREEMIKKRSLEKEEEGANCSPKLAGVCSVPSNLVVSDEAAKSIETREEVIKKRPLEKEEEGGANRSPKLARVCSVPSNLAVPNEAATSTEEMIKKRSLEKEEEEEEEGGNCSPKLAHVCPVPSNLAVPNEAATSTEETIKKRSLEKAEEEGANCSPKLVRVCPVPSNSAVPDEAAKSTETKEGTIKKRSLEQEENEGGNSIPNLALNPDSIELSIMQLQELLIKVKWLKRKLHEEPDTPQWEYVENRVVSNGTTKPNDKQSEPRSKTDSDNHENCPDPMDIDTV